jgi:diaminopimelate decarboxylase
VSAFAYRDGELHAEGVPLSEIAQRFGTPCYVYSRAAIEDAYRAYDSAFAGTDHLVCYAMKANSNLAVLDILARLGSGFDIVSGGELARVLAVGGDPGKVVFSGVGKTEAEMAQALDAGILCFNVESAGSSRVLTRSRVARKAAPVSCVTRTWIPRPSVHGGGLKEAFGIAFDDAKSTDGQDT